MVVIAEATKTKSGKVDWKTVRGLMVDAIYGGRVDNPHDMRVLATYLRQYFNSAVVSGLLENTAREIDSFSRIRVTLICFEERK